MIGKRADFQTYLKFWGSVIVASDRHRNVRINQDFGYFPLAGTDDLDD